MRILKKGEGPKPFTGSCRRCRAQVEFEEKEAFSVERAPREQGELARVKCPECGYEIIGYR